MNKHFIRTGAVVGAAALGIWGVMGMLQHISKSRNAISKTEQLKPVAAETDNFDDLQRITGIGPKISGLLRDSGVQTYSRLSQMKVDALQALLQNAGMPFIDPSTWPRQAALAAEGKWEALEEFVSSL